MERAVSIDPDILSGTPVFTGTRVPVRALFDFIEGGSTVDEFLEAFDWVKREYVIQVLEDSYRKVVQPNP